MYAPLPPLTLSLIVITYKVVVYAPAERADTLPLFHLYPIMYSALSPNSKYRGFGVYSINKTGSRQNLSVTNANAASEFAAAQHLFGIYSSPCFSVKIVHNYGLKKESAN